MTETITTEEARDLLDRGAQALEVLPPSAFDREHLPGARNIPLPKLTRDAADQLDRDRATVVYCYDTECDLSARGAALLELYGFTEVYDYTGSKTEWMGFGLPVEGTVPDRVRAGGIADRTVPTAGADETIADVEGRGPFIVVVGEGQVVLGTVRCDAPVARSARLSDILTPGPATVRPSITASELAQSMDDDGQDHVLVTTLDGRLLGLVRRVDLTLDA